MRHFARKERKHMEYAVKSRLQSTARNSPAPRKTASSVTTPPRRKNMRVKHFTSTIDPSFIMDAGHTTFPVGQQVSLPGHFDVPIVSEAAHPLAKGYQCRVRLHQTPSINLSFPWNKPTRLSGRYQLPTIRRHWQTRINFVCSSNPLAFASPVATTPILPPACPVLARCRTRLKRFPPSTEAHNAAYLRQHRN